MKITVKHFLSASFFILLAAPCFGSPSYIDFGPVAKDTSALVGQGSMIRVGLGSSSSIWSYGGDYGTTGISFPERHLNETGKRMILRGEFYSYGASEGTYKFEVLVDGENLYWDVKEAGYRISAYITQRQYGAYTVYPPSQFRLGIRYVAMSDDIFKSKAEAGKALGKLGFSNQFVTKTLQRKELPVAQLQREAEALGIVASTDELNSSGSRCDEELH